MIRRLGSLLGDQPLKLTAKIAGGANMFAVNGSAATIGQQNVTRSKSCSKSEEFSILAGTWEARKAAMAPDVATGIVTIDVVVQHLRNCEVDRWASDC